jgi:hypothetical protein
MQIWTIATGALLFTGAFLHVVSLATPDFALGLSRIVKLSFVGTLTAFIGAVLFFGATFMASMTGYRDQLLPIAFGELFVALGCRHQVEAIYADREARKLAESLAKYMDAATENLRVFAKGFLDATDIKNIADKPR